MDRTENRLRGLVVAKYGSIAKFASACNISYARAYRIVTGAQSRDEDDLRLLIRMLDIRESTDIVSLFSLS